MTYPFQSIIDAQCDQEAQAEWEALADLGADDIRAEQGAAEAAPAINLNGHATHAGFDGLFKTLEPEPASRGGVYTEEEALVLLNSRYFIGTSKQETAVFRLNEDGSINFISSEQFKLEVQNIFVETVVKTATGNATKKIPAEKFWKESPYRQQKKIVFKPGGTKGPGEYNLWQGFGVSPAPGSDKTQSLFQHIYEIVCRKDDAKFDYLIRWLAWAVQNPDKHPETVIVLKSRTQGTGKSTLGNVMLKIFGRHGSNIDDKERLLGRFNDWLEDQCFILAEEILWAGDRRAADKIKSLITAPTIQMERKFGGCHVIPNRLHVIMTTNHDHAVAAGVGDRRFVVFDVDDKYACDKAWFDPIYRDLEDGGAGQFLHHLQNVNLDGWHPRRIIKTDESTEQQRMSADTVTQWAQACINADAIVGAGRGPHGNDQTHDLGTAISFKDLHEAYTGFCRQNCLHPVDMISFGKACTEMFGRKKRLRALHTGSRRPGGYPVPKANKWQEKVDARLGIKK